MVLKNILFLCHNHVGFICLNRVGREKRTRSLYLMMVEYYSLSDCLERVKKNTVYHSCNGCNKGLWSGVIKSG
jgi:hypothetical protein